MFIENYLSQEDELSLLMRAVEATYNGIVITDPRQPDNPIVYTNPAFTRITGYSAAEILGKNCRFLQGQEHEQPEVDKLRRSISEKSSITVVLRNYRKDGSRFYNELTVSPVCNQQGELIAFIGIQNDISARIEAEQRISDFYAIVSHELRSPLAKIKSSLSVISDGEAGPISDTVRRFVEISLGAAEGLWKIIENILDFKKLEAGKFRLLKQKLRLEEFVSNIVTEFRPVFNEASIRVLGPQPANTGSIELNADPQLLRQLLENLLSNAVKYSRAGSQVEIKAELVENGSFARVEIKDQGIGIAREDLQKLFEKFQQLESADRRRMGGSGLGLSICKAIVTAHNGRIGVESIEAKGSTFWFELPLD